MSVSGGGGTGSSLTKSIAQTGHGFSLGATLRLSGTSTYSLSQGDTVIDAEFIGMVSTVTDSNDFILTTYGYVSGLTGVLDDAGNPLVADTVYFLSPITAGLLTLTKPTGNGQVIKPVFITDTTTSGYIVNYLGDLISTAGVTITLTGDVTGTGVTSIATTIANNAVSYAKFQQVAASSLVGNATGSTANATGITLGAGLAFSGSTLTNSSTVTNSDGTITVTGTAPSAVVSLALGHANTWTAKQTIQLTTAQLQVGYDGSDYLLVTIGSTGSATLALTGTSPIFTFSQSAAFGNNLYTTSGFLGSNNVTTNSNFASTGGGGYAGSNNAASIQFAGSSNVQFRNVFRGNAAGAAFTANVSAANTISGQQIMTAATSGTHPLLANWVFLAPIITGGAANITNLANVYIDAAPTVTGGTGTVGPSYALWAGGTIRMDVGSDATGDLYYRSSTGGMARLGVGSAGQYLGVSSSLPAWQSFAGVSNYTHTIFTPSTGGTVALVNNQYNIINPSGALVALTINLPSSPANNSVVYIKYTQAITTVTYGNGTVVDGITAPTAGGLVVLTYDSATTSWY